MNNQSNMIDGLLALTINVNTTFVTYNVDLELNELNLLTFKTR